MRATARLRAEPAGEAILVRGIGMRDIDTTATPNATAALGLMNLAAVFAARKRRRPGPDVRTTQAGGRRQSMASAAFPMETAGSYAGRS